LLLASLALAAAPPVLAADAGAPISLTVDASDAPRKILHARMAIPAGPGAVTLVYPKWIPGEHGPTGPIAELAGIKMTAAGRPVAWQRDPVDMYALHAEVPAGASSLDVAVDYLLPAVPEGFTSGASASAQLVVVSWNEILLYPQGRPADDVTFAATLRLPPGWKYGTALPVARASGETIEFKPASLVTLIDSPVIAGAHFRTLPLNPGKSPSHVIDMAADSEAALAIAPEHAAAYARLVDEAYALFGARHYQGYHFLLALSDHVAHFGLEHHESSDNRVPERTLLDDAPRRKHADLLSHEFVHSWNGKYRRPAGLATPDYQVPMKSDLLWVYEGLTEYLGYVLAARSGLRTLEDSRAELARVAAYLDVRPGRTWRPLADTAVAAQILYDAPDAWASWRRRVDFYDESTLIWLEADVIIRGQSNGRKSLDDFCRRFHGAPGGPAGVKTYTFDDVVRTLNEVEPYDWKTFFVTRLTSTAPHAPLGGIENGGWRLAYGEAQSDHLKAIEQADGEIDLTYSLGLTVKEKVSALGLTLEEDGTLKDVLPGKPAAEAGAGPGMRIVAVNGRRWSKDVLHEAIAAARTSSEPLELILENSEFFKTCRINYHEGEKYPRLERDPSRPDLLTEILKPIAPKVPAAAKGTKPAS